MAKKVDRVPRLKSWQVWNALRKNVGAGKIAVLFGVDIRSIEDYAVDPDDPMVTCKCKRDPLERLYVLFTWADDIGLGQYVRAAVDYLYSSLDNSDNPGVKAVLSSIELEMLEDFPALVKYHEATKNGEEIAVVKQLEREVKEEIERTTIRFQRDTVRN